MKTLVFSDTHFTNEFDQKKFNKLANLINEADRVIIDGDFWEGLIVTFDEFLNSEWRKLFPMLKAKKAVYVYGNHDDQRLSDERVYEFCDNAVSNYEFLTNKHNYFFTHGHQYLFPRHKEDHINEKGEVPFSKKWNAIIGTKIQKILFGLFGPNIFPKSFNEMTLEERKAIAPMDYLLVCGHSHTPQYKPEFNFIDIGFFNYGWANYMLIDDKGDFEFKSEKY